MNETIELPTPGVNEGDVTECKIGGRWHRVSTHNFRSWTGERRVNGEAYRGPVFYLGSETVSRPA